MKSHNRQFQRSLILTTLLIKLNTSLWQQPAIISVNLSKPQIMKGKKKNKKKIIIWLNCKNEWSPGYFEQQVLILLIVNTGCSHIYLLPLYLYIAGEF